MICTHSNVRRAGKWQTLAFRLPTATAATIASGLYSDLTFSVVFNVASNQTGHYLLDNLRAVPDVVPSLLGVAKVGTSVKAVFDYVTTSSMTIPYGTANGLNNESGFLASPSEMPPTIFAPTTHAPFVATIAGSLLTWTLGGHSVTATSNSSQLPVTTLGDGTHDATLADGRRVNLDSVPPPNPVNASGPPVGAPFNGLLTGQFDVSPSGAATYTVPISIPPGIAGMAPNLALVYNSQGGDGLAGQGWNLSGLSTIARCPRTRQQDGYGRPVKMDSLTPSQNSDGLSDGICLDGGKLFEQSPGSGSYFAEKQDFSTITLDGTGAFQVKTKAGETRYYGRLAANRVSATQTAVWLLDRVVDAWGNYFDIQYNDGQGDVASDSAHSFLATGVWPSKIDYTGSLTDPSCTGTTPPSTCTFASVTFQYQPQLRDKWRWSRYGTLKLPQNKLLAGITTSQGNYSLTYPAQNGLSPQLGSIGYCAGTTCMKPMTFTWENIKTSEVVVPIPQPWWQASSAYSLPSFVAPGKGLKGTQFVDLNGDGRLDFVLGRANGNGGESVPQVAAVLNTGSGWGPPLTGPGQTFPVYLSDQADNPTGVRFADLDGDGRIDVMVDGANVTCGADGSCVSCPVGNQCSSTHYGPAVWLNRFTVDGQGGWLFSPSYSGASVNFTGSNPTIVADVDGDGRADFIQVTQQQEQTDPDGNVTAPTTTTVNVLINKTTQGVHTWPSQTTIYSGTVPPFSSSAEAPFHVEDVNRDGLADLVHSDFFRYPDGSVAAAETVLLNKGPDQANSFRFAAPLFHSAPSGGSRIGVGPYPPHFADIDGDGFYDAVRYAPATGSQLGYDAAVGFGDGTGAGFGDNPGQQYLNILKAFSPPPGSFVEDYGFALADIDGDGLTDLVRNHIQLLSGDGNPNNNPPAGGEILLNTGRTWVSVTGATGWQDAISSSIPQGRIPAVVPSETTSATGSAFLDLDGDGMPDLIQQQESNGSPVNSRGAWLNPYRHPIITAFPNGLAKPTKVVYVSTASAAGASTYKDDDVTESNTKLFAIPLTVVASTGRFRPVHSRREPLSSRIRSP